MSINVDLRLDCKGLSCPMPIVRTKKAIDQLQAGQVVEVEATDPGSLADIEAWAKSTGHQYLGTKHEEDVLKHYLRKASESELKEVRNYPDVIPNEELLEKLNNDEKKILIDVREPAEYAFGHIPQAYSIPFDQLEKRMNELPKDQPIYVICQTGNRSDIAAQRLTEHGFKNVMNVVPGMSKWVGPIDQEK